jgi:membrane-associated phospholipid phosphatase
MLKYRGVMYMTIGIVEFIQSFSNGFLDLFFNFISFLGEEYVYIVILGTIYYAMNKKTGEFLAFSLFFAGVLNGTLKVIFNAPRPFQKYPDRVENLRPDTATGKSFPSGHTQSFTTFSFAGAFITKSKKILIFAIVFSLLMAISRMYLGVHFFEDVFVSLLLGVTAAYYLNIVFDRLKEEQKHKLYFIMIGLFLPFVVFLGDEGLFKAYGLLIGFALAMIYEKKHVQFSLDISVQKKIIRVLSGLVIMLAVRFVLSFIFDIIATEGTMLMNFFDFLRYLFIAFIGLGLYPKLFTKYHF